MKTKNLVMALVTAGVLGATGYGLYALGMHRGMSMATAPAMSTATTTAAGKTTAG